MVRIVGFVLAVLVGVIIGFFGAFKSVFSDGGGTERIITITIILVLYGALGFVWGFISPTYGAAWGILLAVPGTAFLGLYLIREWHPLYIVYMVGLMIFACTGAWSGSRARKARISKE